MAPASYESDPDALRAHFAIELRRLRTRAGLSMNQLAQAIGCTPQWIYQMEQVDKAVPEQTALDFDTYFKTEGWEESDGLFVRIYRAIQRAGRRRVLLPGFEAYLQHEAEAIGIRYFSAQLVPGLLQIEGYARALMDPGEPAETLDARVSGRMKRQAIFDRPKPPRLTCVLDESVLRRPIGGPQVMFDQIDHLIKMSRLPHVSVRLMPFERVTPPALVGNFMLLSFAKGTDLLYTEAGGVGNLTECKETVFKAEVDFDTVMGEALSQTESIELMGRAQKEFQ
ncbi:helix-turn-helix transcriptional regulator [Actinocorallia sp. B10E7]|uniref:helix-turn-helix domain-containing protein n=1 Tax=Actinocorallia sp. B10E7 TaxID=3153558 RepID=UPI00325ECD3A